MPTLSSLDGSQLPWLFAIWIVFSCVLPLWVGFEQMIVTSSPSRPSSFFMSVLRLLYSLWDRISVKLHLTGKSRLTNQVSVITLNKIHFISPEVNVVHTHFKVCAILRLIFTSGVLRARLLIENTCTRHNYIECISWMNPISIKSSAPEVKKETFRF